MNTRKSALAAASAVALAAIAAIVPMSSASAAGNGQISIINNCGYPAYEHLYNSSGYLLLGGTAGTGETVTYYPSAGETWRVETPGGTHYVYVYEDRGYGMHAC